MAAANQNPGNLKQKRIDLIKLGQASLSVRNFKKSPNCYQNQFYFFFTGAIIAAALIPVGFNSLIENGVFSKDTAPISYYDYFGEMAKIVFGTLFAFWIVIIATNTWQQRSISFTMIQELNSYEFHKIRNTLWFEMGKAVEEERDIEEMSGWYPFTELYVNRINTKTPPVQEGIEKHTEKHSLTNFMYYAVRFANYHKSKMINRQLTRHLFHFFFSHYHILMLEFALKLRAYRIELNRDGFPYDERWDLMSDDIILFLKMIGLSETLPEDHTFIYYPSLNS